MTGETELMKAAGGDFNLTLIAFLIIAIVALIVYLVYWITNTSMKQSEKNNERLVEKICTLINCLNSHDERAREIGKEVSAIKQEVCK